MVKTSLTLIQLNPALNQVKSRLLLTRNIHHGAWIEGLRANNRFTRFVIPCENQA